MAQTGPVPKLGAGVADGAGVMEGVGGGVRVGVADGDAPTRSEGVGDGVGDTLPHVSCRTPGVFVSSAYAAPVILLHTKRDGQLKVT